MVTPKPVRVAVVTGSNKNIGYFIALQLGLSGLFSDIILACRNSVLGLQAAQEMQQRIDGSENEVNVQFAPLDLGDRVSQRKFARKMEQDFGKVDVLVNNAAIAFKMSDPTPFVDQCKPTLDINFRSTVDFTETMLPLVRKGTDPRITTVASMSGHLNQLKTAKLCEAFSSAALKMPELNRMVNQFESNVTAGTHIENGWGNSNYGMSKLAIIAATKIWSRENTDIAVNCCCPGYCRTDMSSFKGPRLPEEGARNAVIPTIMEDPPTGAYFSDFEIASW